MVNIPKLAMAPRYDKCVFSMVGLKNGGALINGTFVVNASIDLSQANTTQCTELYVSPFNNVNGSLTNITVLGFINITNFNGTQFNASVPLRLGKFFGNLNFTNNTAGGNRYVGGPSLKTLSSSLVYSVNNVTITSDSQVLNISSKNFTVRLVNEFESTMP